MSLRVRVAPLALISIASGCISGILGASDVDRLSEARARWDGLSIETYEIDFQRSSCECLPASVIPVRLRVTLDSIESGTQRTSGSPISGEDLALYFTVQDVFDQITNAVSQDAFVLDVEYDERFGFPRTVRIDIDEMVADDEITYTMQNLEIVTQIPKNPSPAATGPDGNH